MLTLKDLQEMKPGEIIADGQAIDGPGGLNMANTGEMLRWVAVRGDIDDWAIYCHVNRWTLEYILDHGDKVHSQINIRKLVECDNEAWERYRH